MRWDSPPVHNLGPHTGLPGPVKPEDLAESEAPCMVFCPTQGSTKSFFYPGDSETFGQGFRITDRVGLKNLGIWYENLPRGKRSAFPHAHTLINETDEPVTYICIGETQEFIGEKISYPLHPLRRQECERKGWYWTDAPSLPRGAADCDC